MSVVRYFFACGVLMLLGACADIPQRTAWMGGVSTQDAKEITQLLRARTSSQIIEFRRSYDGKCIDVWLYDHDTYSCWCARRVGKTWKLEQYLVTS